jgi:hypothetical protein
MMFYGRKTANINSKKRQSHLNLVVIGHRKSKTAKIMKRNPKTAKITKGRKRGWGCRENEWGLKRPSSWI